MSLQNKLNDLSISKTHLAVTNPLSLLKIRESLQSLSEKDKSAVATTSTLATTNGEISLPEYEKIKIVGRGSFGVAILYRKQVDKSLVVLKQINLCDLTKSEKEMAMNEVEVFSKLHHPNIICYLGSFIRVNVLLIEMEYANGGTLAQILTDKEQTNAFMPERYILNVFEQITSAINYMHSENIMHRDLKTANVFLNNRGIVKIGDFGISKIMNTKIHAQTVLGTPYYFSPEMCEGKDYDNKSDIWALGCILGEMCCLKKAFAATNLSELVAKIMAAQYIPLPNSYSEGLKSLIKQLLQVESINRPTACELLQYWIPLVYRNIGKNRGYEFNIDDSFAAHDSSTTMSSKAAAEYFTSNQYMNASTATISDARVERSVLYQLNSFGTNVFLNPLQLPSNIKIASVATNGSHFLVVTADGLVYSWGEGNTGQLGHGNIEIWKQYPNKIESIKKYKIIGACAGEGFSIFWSDLGVVFSCGDNSKGCLGHLDLQNYQQPKAIERLNDIRITQISCGAQHVVALSDDNHIYSWGTCRHGGLGLGNQNSFSAFPHRVLSTYFNEEILQICCGIDCTIILLRNGDVLASGKNNDNKLGFGKKINKSMIFKKITEINKRVVDVSVSSSHTVFLIEGGYVITMGKNIYAQRGIGNCNPIDTPTLVTGIKDKFIKKVKCSSTYSVVFSDDNVITLWGTRSGIPDQNDHFLNGGGGKKLSTASQQSDAAIFELGNSTGAFTNFLASVYKSETILDPIDILALYSSEYQLAKGYYLKLSNIYPLHHSILVLVDTTTPLASNSS